MKKTTNTSKTPRPEWLMGGNPTAIVEQEAQGQKELVESLQLPRKCSYPHGLTDTASQYRKMGIKVFTTTKGDDLFLGTKLPAGWKKQETDHDMWSDLIDDKGRKRASIFYKASFYDRKSEISFNHRIHFRVDRIAFLNNDYSKTGKEYNGNKTPFVGRVTDFDGKVLFETEPIQCDIEYITNERGHQGYSDKYNEESRKAEMELKEKCLKFLADNYPDYKDINAYWDK